jgi:Domain of unknown function (DUF4384)/Domain of unknown function (DUF4388)
MKNNSPNLNSFCRSIGLIYDRTAPGAPPIGSTFLVADKKVASLASITLPYATTPQALRVMFPSTEIELGVSAVHLHPKFDRSLTQETALHGTLGNGPEAALQKFNCSILDLVDKLQELTTAQTEQVSQALRYPLSLTDENFRGSLTEIELPLVIQTLNNAKREGILYICDDMYRPIAQIFCQGGKVLAAKYRSLMNELAIYQIVEKRLTGRFAFRACKPPIWMPAQTINRSTDMLLIEAMRRQDENINFKKKLGSAEYLFVRAYKQLYMENIAVDFRQAVELIWRVLDGTVPAEDLWNLVPLDDYTILAALNEMYASNQCMRVPLAGTMQFNIPKMPDESYAPAFFQSVPLPLGIQLPLNAFDTMSSIAIDPNTSKPRVKVGALLGAIDPYDATHLLHDIPLLPWASGSPLIKDDLVIGMHCGVVPNSSTADNSFGVLQQMLWCDSIEQILKAIPGTVIPPSVPLRGDPEDEEEESSEESKRKHDQHERQTLKEQQSISLAQLKSTIPEDVHSSPLFEKAKENEPAQEPSLKDTLMEGSHFAAKQGDSARNPDLTLNETIMEGQLSAADAAALRALGAESGSAAGSNATSSSAPDTATGADTGESEEDTLKLTKVEKDSKASKSSKSSNPGDKDKSAKAGNKDNSGKAGDEDKTSKLDNKDKAVKPESEPKSKSKSKSAAAAGGQLANKGAKKLENPVETPKGPPGCREIASLRCAICGERTFGSARRCTRCQNEFIPQLKKEVVAKRVDLAMPIASVLAVFVLATAAFALSKLPVPIYEDVALMSVPNKPLIKLQLIQAFSNEWMERPSGTKFSSDDAIALRVLSNEPCYLYLLMKESSAKKASLLFPNDQTPQNSLAQGETITYPGQLSTRTANGLAYNTVKLGGNPGADEILAIAANPNSLRILENANNQDPVFEKAKALLAMSKSSAVLVSASQVLPDSKPVGGEDTKNNAQDPNEMVYITMVSARH